ncbi:hypothetical protein BCV70DRAFT_198483 [Testicularia cyperi]|uniref:RED-like N-terminal domain-containing protein n=1 Tax=Testicularia cyperi TaxID=1882483 RepID=A0A317XV42_9BASI|nr:hypothetical protein BCV70DRAFT_198483 [Testicularia cyperi]
MDQEAFRSMLSGGGGAGESSSSLGNGSSSSSTGRAFGKAHRRLPNAAASSGSIKPSDLKPPKRSASSVGGDEGHYVDRAAARRQGKAHEFTDVEKLHAELAARIESAENEDQRRTLQQHMRTVGGDAKHSVLVKGLDFSLLAENKARLARDGGNAGSGDQEEEDDLEAAFNASKRSRLDETPAQSAANNPEQKPTRSREDIVAALKRSRLQRADRDTHYRQETATATKPSLGKGFRPIGAPRDDPANDDPEYKWVNGKRMRKKKKKQPTSEPNLSTPTTSKVQTTGSSSPDSNVIHTSTSIPKARATTQPASLKAKAEQKPSTAESPKTGDRFNSESTGSVAGPSTGEGSGFFEGRVQSRRDDDRDQEKAEDSDEDEDDDIFAGVGAWQGVEMGGAESSGDESFALDAKAEGERKANEETSVEYARSGANLVQPRPLNEAEKEEEEEEEEEVKNGSGSASRPEPPDVASRLVDSHPLDITELELEGTLEEEREPGLVDEVDEAASASRDEPIAPIRDRGTVIAAPSPDTDSETAKDPASTPDSMAPNYSLPSNALPTLVSPRQHPKHTIVTTPPAPRKKKSKWEEDSSEEDNHDNRAKTKKKKEKKKHR